MFLTHLFYVLKLCFYVFKVSFHESAQWQYDNCTVTISQPYTLHMTTARLFSNMFFKEMRYSVPL